MQATLPRDEVELLDDPGRASSVLSPLRRQLLSELVEPGSATSVAGRLGLARQKVNYHLRQLEKGGFVELVETRKRRGCTERILRATRSAYVLSPRLLGALGRPVEQVRDRFSSAYLVAEACRLADDVSTLRKRAEAAGERLLTFTLTAEASLASPAAAQELVKDLRAALAKTVAKHAAAQGVAGARPFRIVLGGCPVITKQEDESDDADT